MASPIEKPETLGIALIALVVLLVYLPIGMAWSAWVLATVWNWWIPTTLPMPELTMAGALGISFVRSALWFPPSGSKKTAWEQTAESIVRNVTLNAWLLAIAWVAHLLVF